MKCSECNRKGKILANAGGIFVEARCDRCNGTGEVSNPGACSECNGSGTVIANAGGIFVEARCDRCNGTGLNP